MKVGAKPGAAVSHIPKQKTETWRDSTAAAPQVQTPLRCVGCERRRVSCDEPKPTRSKEVPAVNLMAAAISGDIEA